ncbi:hypothetical protein LSAT2_015221 [Lamellibrachia satsuma]|nr:hypothetical protein LSAT2_015221 [Lamellibrachia satsuma]
MGKTFARCRTQRFASKVTHNPAISCSDDAQVAVCTDEGVYILMIRCDQIYPSNNIVLHTSRIAPSSKVKTFDVDVPRQKLERTLPKSKNHFKSYLFFFPLLPCGVGSKSLVGWGPSHLWGGVQVTCGVGSKSLVGWGPSHLWGGVQVTCGVGSKSLVGGSKSLVGGPSHLWGGPSHLWGGVQVT